MSTLWMPDPAWMFTTSWLLAGAVMAWTLSSRGHAQEAALAALVAWPFFLPMLSERPTAPAIQGPHGVRIDRTLAAVRQALQDAGVGTEHALGDLDSVAEALHEADARIARVDVLLADEDTGGDAVDRERAALETARDEAATDLDSVLAGLAQLRLQVGRLALAGDTAPIGARLRELRARVSALGELQQPPTR